MVNVSFTLLAISISWEEAKQSYFRIVSFKDWAILLTFQAALSSVILSPRRVSPFLRGVIFTCARVSLALLSLRKNGDYS